MPNGKKAYEAERGRGGCGVEVEAGLELAPVVAALPATLDRTSVFIVARCFALYLCRRLCLALSPLMPDIVGS